jgi:hypothetical protein
MFALSLSIILSCFVHTYGQDVVRFSAANRSSFRDSKTGIHFANFLEAKSKLLGVTPLKVVHVKSKNRCKFECLKDLRCFSYNIAVSPSSGGQYQCQILDKEMVFSSQFLSNNENFDHFSIKVRKILLRTLLYCSRSKKNLRTE